MNRPGLSRLSIAGLLISAVSIALLIHNFNISELLSAFKSIEPMLFVPVLILILASFVLRTIRWNSLIEHSTRIKFSAVFEALMVGYLMNNILPARAGDLARVYHLHKRSMISKSKVLATLVTEKLVDLTFTLSLFGLVSLTYPALPTWIKQGGSAIFFVTIITGVILATLHVGVTKKTSSLPARLLNLLPSPFDQKLRLIFEQGMEGVAGLFRVKRIFAVVLVSVMLWAVEVVIVTTVASACDVELSYGNSLFLLVFLALGTSIPSSPGALGTYELVGLAALGALSITGPQALAFIIVLHTILYLSSSILGLLVILTRSYTSLLQIRAP